VKLLSFYQDRSLRVAKAQGQYVWDENGRRYLDLHIGNGVAFLGHRHPKVVEALKEQMNQVMTLSTAFQTQIRESMLRELDNVKPEGMDNVFLLNSGAEAVELGLKIARKVTGRRKFIAFRNSFHGRSAGSLSVTWNRKYREPFEPLLEPVEFLPFNDVEALKAVDQTTAAVVVEPIQGEGGVIPATHDFMRALREVTEKNGTLLILDEVQTGWRTGKVWAYQHFGIVPDVLTAGKAIGGGFPVSAVFLPDWIREKLDEGDHGTTYGGNPLAAAAVAASCRVLREENVVERTESMGAEFMRSLAKLKERKSVREIRGMGLMIGIDIRLNPGPAIKQMQDEGVIALKAGSTVIRFLAPYLIDKDDINVAVAAAEKGISFTEAKFSP
jgi:acetylornithine and succinylornithine aminotransferases